MVGGEDEEYFRKLISQLDSDEEEEEKEEVETDRSRMVTSDLPSSKPMITSDFDKLALCTSDPTSGGHAAVDLTSEIMGIDWDDIPDSLKATPIPMPDKTPVLPTPVSASLFTMTGNVERMLDSAGDFRMYWFDALERPQTGAVYLFGKTRDDAEGEFTSCCVAVTGLQRQVYFLPKNGADWAVVSQEIQELCAKQRIVPTALERVTRKYAFEVKGIPRKAEWVLLTYPFSQPQLTYNQNQNSSISHVLGLSTSALEILLVTRGLMGPAWIFLRPTLIAKKSVSWCRLEMECAQPESIRQLLEQPPEPPLTCLSLNVRFNNNNNSGKQRGEVALISGVCFSTAENSALNTFTVVSNGALSERDVASVQAAVVERGNKLEVTRNERALLSYFIAVLQRIDPDVIISHSLLGVDVGGLLRRLKACRVDFWSRLGRLNWSQWPKGGPAERSILSGRLPLDTSVMSRELVKDKSFTLSSLAENVLQMNLPTGLPFIEKDQQHLVEMIRHCQAECTVQMLLVQKLAMLPLTRQLSNIAGNLWARTLQGARAERNEYLFLHEFGALGYICPDKRSYNNNTSNDVLEEEHSEGEGKDEVKGEEEEKKNNSYVGGLVLEPQRGFYDQIVLLLDFNSLYPSIIQEFNICFVEPGDGESPILPRILGNLVSRRRQVKQMMKGAGTDGERAMLNIRQQALKLTANSIYGCLGFSASRFYAKPLAMAITGHGRRILQETVNLAQELGLQVIYGDTDSIMVATGTVQMEEAQVIAEKLKRAVNGRYRLLEIELDGVFRKLLLLRKKKYATMTMEGRVETKGLDMVRRDWCALSCETSEHVLQLIMDDSGNKAERILCHLQDVSQKVRTGGFSVEKYLINKMLTKEPEAYPDPKNQPHVMVALRMRQNGLAVHREDTISFVIVESASAQLLSERARTFEEAKFNKEVVDYEWYLTQQVFPPVARLCEFVPGLDHVKLAQAFGLDTRKYVQHNKTSSSSNDKDGLMMEELKVKCGGCERESVVSGSGECVACGASLPITSIVKRIDEYCNEFSLITMEDKMRFYRQLTFWKNTLNNSNNISNTVGVGGEDEERRLKKMRVTGEELGMVRMLLGKRIESMCGDFVSIDLKDLFSFYSNEQ